MSVVAPHPQDRLWTTTPYRGGLVLGRCEISGAPNHYIHYQYVIKFAAAGPSSRSPAAGSQSAAFGGVMTEFPATE